MTYECVSCGAAFESAAIDSAVEPRHCPLCVALDRRDTEDCWLGLPMVAERDGVRFSRSSFVRRGQWCFAGTRLPVRVIQRAIADEGPEYVRLNWPGHDWTDQVLAAVAAFVAPAPAGEAMRAEEV